MQLREGDEQLREGGFAAVLRLIDQDLFFFLIQVLTIFFKDVTNINLNLPPGTAAEDALLSNAAA